MSNRSRKLGYAATYRSAQVPAPVGGWNAQAAISDMPEADAVILDNWIPRPGYVECRRGNLAITTGFSASVQSLLAWRGPTVDKLFAVSGTGVYLSGQTTPTAVGAALYTGLSTPRVQYVNFANSAGNFLVCVTGNDAPFKYDGTSFTTTAITGPTNPNKLIDVMAHKRRLWFTEADTLRTWYLPTDAITGAATLLDLGPLANLGGAIQSAATWTLDGGNGPDDYAVWVTTQGQIIIFKGTDPAVAANWSLVGVFTVGIPLGRRCLLNYGAELVALTADGVIPLSQALALDRAQDSNIALTAKIQNAFALASMSYAANFGWDAMLYPKGQLAIYNVPITSLGVSYQYVQNVQTGAWCRFLGLHSFCWAYANGKPYFGSSTTVNQWDTGSSDNGTAITCDIQTSFQGYGGVHRIKQFKMLRPILRAPLSVFPWVDVNVDYQNSLPGNIPSTTSVNQGLGIWDISRWDMGYWSDSNLIRLDWTTTTGVGFVGAVRMRIVLNPTINAGTYQELATQLISFDMLYQMGSVI